MTTINIPAFTINIPTISITDVLLATLCILLYRCLLVIKEAVSLLKEQHRKGQRSVSYEEPESQPRLQRSSSFQKPTLPNSPQSPSPPEVVVDRFLRNSAQYFAECLLDERDVDVSKFITACRHFGTVLEKAGPFTMLSIRETHSNIAKIENTFLLVREPLHKWGSDPVRVLSLAHLLAASSTALIALHPSHSHLVLFRILIASARW